jgi:drug/metabolite transporter (DMT)-like permease
MAVRDVPPLTLALLRFAQGSLVLFVGLATFRRDLLRVHRRDLPYLALLGALFFTIFPVTFNAGLRYIEASRAALLIATMPLWSVLLGRLLARERLSTRQIAGVVISIAGVAIAMANRGGPAKDTGASTKGELLLLTTALCGAIYNVLAKRMLARYSGLTVTAYAMAFGTLFLLPAVVFERAPSISALGGQTLALLLYLGVIGGAVGFALWTTALEQLSPTEVAVYINLNPVAATLLAAVVLHEHLSGRFGVGLVAVAVGVLTVNWTEGFTRQSDGRRAGATPLDRT